MSIHSYTRCWVHMIWGTLRREKLLPKQARIRVSNYFYKYAKEKNIYMKINYVCPDHVHVLIDLPTNYSLEDVFQLLKGSSSHWINHNDLIPGKFTWGRGYGGFSVSHSIVSTVANYIAEQEKHHRKMTFLEEYKLLIEKYGLVFHKEDE